MISLFLAKNWVLNGPEMLNLSAIFRVASFTWKYNSLKPTKSAKGNHYTEEVVLDTLA